MKMFPARARDRPCFQTARFPEFWQNAIPAKEDKKQLPKLAARADITFIGIKTCSTCRDRP